MCDSSEILQIIITTIDQSDLFDELHYIKVSGFEGSRSSLIEHYVSFGEIDGLSPSESFDVKFYALGNPDVFSTKSNLLYHYILHGRPEGRFGNKSQVRNAALLLKEKKFFDQAYYSSMNYEVLLPDLDDVEEQVALWRLGRRPNATFDPSFYVSLYPDAQSYPGTPMHHYLELGRKQFRTLNSLDYENYYRLIDKHIDRRFYFSKFPSLSPDEDLTRHYISVGSVLGIDPTPDFSAEYYCRLHPDLSGGHLFPFAHYVLYGREEGRAASPDFSDLIKVGDIDFDDAKSTIIIVNHEASRTGAPLVGLNLAKLFQREYNVITIIGRGGNIEEYFLQNSCFLVTGMVSGLEGEYLLKFFKSKYKVSCVLFNSVESHFLAHDAMKVDLPIVILIHEFSEYTKPASRMAELVRLADYVIVPADLIEKSVQTDVYIHCSSLAPNIIIRPQGALPWVKPENTKSDSDLLSQDILEYIQKIAPQKKKFVLGAGHSQIRKGVDLFVQTAAAVEKIRPDIAFLWVGDGYFPDVDLNYSIWIKEMIERMGLKESVYFFPPQSSLSSFYDVCDVFYLPSRLDPFPNVVIDALQADKYVVCFDGATGCAEMFVRDEAAGAAVPHCDVVAAANAIISALESPQQPGRNSRLVKEQFDFNAYADFIEVTIAQASERWRSKRESVTYLAQSAAFDSSLFTGKPDADFVHALRDYVAGSSKGLSRRNPMRGFSENVYNSRFGHTPGLPALESALRRTDGDIAAIKTHNCVEIGKGKLLRRRRTQKARILLHIHAHYSDEVAQFVSRLNKSGVELDIVATATSSATFSHVEYLLSSFAMGKAKTVLVRNIGRDIGPFLTEMPREMDNKSYDIIGHLHTKKSLWGGNVGESWRDYLLDTLLGNGTSALADIMDLFAASETLGLVFPDDGNNIGWSANFEHARAIGGKFPGGLKIPDRPMFPVGNMFWARSAALKPLWDLNLSIDDLPSEPVPYDGSILHAIERLTPSIVEYAGFHWSTVYVDGVVR